MIERRHFLFLGMAAIACTAADSAPAAPKVLPTEPGLKDLPADPAKVEPVTRTAEEWKAVLSAGSFDVLRNKGTERAFTGAFWDHHAKGTYRCAGCGLDLFSSADKFESGTGWPSYTRPIKADRVKDKSDLSYGMSRDEVVCARCDGHQGHVFDDGPAPTGKRFCINSASLVFRAG